MKVVWCARCVVVFVVLSVGQDALAQSATTAQGQTATIRVKSRIVVLDAVVLDRHGNTVTNLTKDDFVVTENGEEQRIRSFELPREHELPRSATPVVRSAADLSRIGDAPVTILVIDELNTRFEDGAFVRQSLVKYLEGQPAVLRQPAVLLVATNTKFEMLHDYTQDRDALVEAVRRHVPQVPWRSANAGGAGGVELLAQSLAALLEIAQASGGTPGRKDIVWMGKGFPGVNTTTIDDKSRVTIEAAIRRVTNAMLAARVTLYAIDPTQNSAATAAVATDDDGNVLNSSGNSGNPFDAAINFPALAPATGGQFFFSRNDVATLVETSIDRAAEYYTMSYSPMSGSEDPAKYRKIVVRMKNPEYRVVMRDGYFPETAEDANPVLAASTPPKQAKAMLQLDLSNAALSTMVYNGLKVTGQKNDGVWNVMVASKDLDWHDAGAEASVVAAAFDAKGKVLGHFARELRVRAEGASGEYAMFPLGYAPPAGTARMRIVVRDAMSGKIGTWDVASRRGSGLAVHSFSGK